MFVTRIYALLKFDWLLVITDFCTVMTDFCNAIKDLDSCTLLSLRLTALKLTNHSRELFPCKLLYLIKLIFVSILYKKFMLISTLYIKNANE